MGVPTTFTRSIPKCFVSKSYFLLIKPSVGLTDGKLLVTVYLMLSSLRLFIFSVTLPSFKILSANCLCHLATLGAPSHISYADLYASF